MHQLLRHPANAHRYVPAERAETAFFRSRARKSSETPRHPHDRWRTPGASACPPLAVIYDGASVVKNTITAVRDTGQTRMVYLRAAEE